MRRTFASAAVSIAVGLALLATACGSEGDGGGEPTVPPSVALPSVSGLDGLVTYLSDHGVTCDHVDIENEGATAVPNGPQVIAMCYRPAGQETLELSVFATATDRATKRPASTTLPCGQSADLRALDGLVMSIAEGENFDLRAADSQSLTPASLATLNAATEAIAAQAMLRVGHVTLACAG